jgi:hypothetical protein
MPESSGRSGIEESDGNSGRTALPTRLANLRIDFNIWLEQCSNWQFVAATACINVLAYAVGACVDDLITNFNLTTFLTSAVIETAVLTSFFAWRRWK